MDTEALWPMLKPFAGALIRALLAALTGYLEAHHILSDAQARDTTEQVTAYLLDHALIWGPAVVTVVWSLWQKVRQRKVLLAALDLPAGTTEARAQALATLSRPGLSGLVPVLVIALVGLSVGACGLRGHKTKTDVVVSLQSTERLLEAVHDAERALCNGTADQTKPIPVCNAQGVAVGLTTDRHRQLAGLFEHAFQIQKLAAGAVARWRAGDPPPATLAQYAADVRDILGVVQQLAPGNALLVQMQAIVAQVAQVATVVGVR